jgi:hypothetical protein
LWKLSSVDLSIDTDESSQIYFFICKPDQIDFRYFKRLAGLAQFQHHISIIVDHKYLSNFDAFLSNHHASNTLTA